MENVWEAAFEDEAEPLEVVEEVEDSLSDDLAILIEMGRLYDTFDFWGHRFIIKTLKIGEELQVSSIAARYSETLDQARAYMLATIAASIDTVDGMPIASAIGPNDKAQIERAFNYLSENYYWPVVQEIYDRYTKLIERVDKATEEIKKK